MMNPWAKGLITAFVSAAATALGAMMIDPEHFDLAHLKHLAIVGGLGGCVGVVNYLRQQPVPATWNGEERRAPDPSRAA